MDNQCRARRAVPASTHRCVHRVTSAGGERVHSGCVRWLVSELLGVASVSAGYILWQPSIRPSQLSAWNMRTLCWGLFLPVIYQWSFAMRSSARPAAAIHSGTDLATAAGATHAPAAHGSTTVNPQAPARAA